MTPGPAVTRYVAFLRAINVGGHVVKMDRLRQLFEAMGFSGVKTFIASGNVLFDSPSGDPAALESTIAKRLAKALGYEVATFVRSAQAVRRIAGSASFSPADSGAPGTSVYVGFFGGPLSSAARKAVLAFRTDQDDFHTDRCEMYWLCRISVLDSKVSWARLEKALGGRATFRNIKTVRRIAATLEATVIARRT